MPFPHPGRAPRREVVNGLLPSSLHAAFSRPQLISSMILSTVLPPAPRSSAGPQCPAADFPLPTPTHVPPPPRRSRQRRMPPRRAASAFGGLSQTSAPASPHASGRLPSASPPPAFKTLLFLLRIVISARKLAELLSRPIEANGPIESRSRWVFPAPVTGVKSPPRPPSRLGLRPDRGCIQQTVRWAFLSRLRRCLQEAVTKASWDERAASDWTAAVMSKSG